MLVVSFALCSLVAIATAASIDPLINFLLDNQSPKSHIPLSFAVPADYWSQIGSRPDNATDTAERILATYGLNLYDASVWSIAVALGGHFDRARTITTMLLSDTCGELNSLHGCRGFYYGDSLWTCPNDTTTGYFFRMISDTYANIDPLTGDRVPWMDWRPVSGENAWANFIGPLQSLHLRIISTGERWDFDAPEIQLGLASLSAFEAMLTAIGAIYYAPHGTYHAPIGSISTENCISSFAGFRMMHQALIATGDERGQPYLKRLEQLMSAVSQYMRSYAFNNHTKTFAQGGIYNSSHQHWSPEKLFAVDVQTWGIAVFAADIDEWFGFGSAFQIWQNTKRIGGFYDDDGTFIGVGFTSQPAGNSSESVLSGEWSFGAVTAARSLAALYATSQPDWAASCSADADAMIDGVNRALRIQSADGSSARVLYTDKRFYIPFGWWGNPFGSAASTSWAVFAELKFNPFELGI